MVAQAARRADDDMGALVEQGGLAARVHAADAGDDAGIGVLVEPSKLTLHLQRQFARRRDDQRERLAGAAEGLRLAEQGRTDGEAIGDSLAGAGLRRDEQVAAGGGLLQHGALHRRGFGIVAFGERARERRTRGQEGHGTEGLGLRRGIGMTAQDVGDGRKAQPSIAGLIAQKPTKRNRGGNRSLKGYALRSDRAVIPDDPRPRRAPESIFERCIPGWISRLSFAHPEMTERA